MFQATKQKPITTIRRFTIEERIMYAKNQCSSRRDTSRILTASGYDPLPDDDCTEELVHALENSLKNPNIAPVTILELHNTLTGWSIPLGTFSHEGEPSSLLVLYTEDDFRIAKERS